MPKKYPKGLRLCTSIEVWIGHAERRAEQGREVAPNLWQAVCYADDLADYLRAKYDEARKREQPMRSMKAKLKAEKPVREESSLADWSRIIDRSATQG